VIVFEILIALGVAVIAATAYYAGYKHGNYRKKP